MGIVSRRAAGFVEGVDGRVGGTCESIECILLVELLLCALARDEAVPAEYPLGRGWRDEEDEPDACALLVSINDDKDAFLFNLRWAVLGGEGDLSPE